MSTKVTKEDWPSLEPIRGEQYSLGRCDYEPSHGGAVAFMQTPDKRNVVLCFYCFGLVNEAKRNAVEAPVG